MNKFYKHRNFYALITTLTITVMFFVILYVTRRFPDDVNQNLWAALVLSLIISSGLFTAISSMLSKIFENSKRIKALLLNKQYLEGIWIGFIEGEKEISFVVEKIEQTFEDINLNGISYQLKNKNELLPTATWRSTVAKIAGKESEFQYTYVNTNLDTAAKSAPDEGVQEKSFTGFARFYFEIFSNKNNEFLNSEKFKFPLLKSCSMYGQLSDFDPKGTILLSTEIKITDSLQYDLNYFKKYAYMFWLHRRNMSRLDASTIESGETTPTLFN